MTEQISEDLPQAAVAVRHKVCERYGDTSVVQRDRWSERPVAAHPGQPLTLAAVLRHVLQLDSTCAPRAIASIDDADRVRTTALLDDALDSCLQLDAARLQLQNAITTRGEVETVSEMLAARVCAGQTGPVDQWTLEAGLNLAHDAVTRALDDWGRAGRRFTKLTRLLPVQLECIVDEFGPISADEMDRLAEACLWTHADVHLSLRERARAWTDRRAGSVKHEDVKPEDFNVWIARIEQSREQAAADFACAREVYLQAILDHDREHACFVRSRSVRRTVETSFRLGARSATELTEALLEESRRLHAVFLLRACGRLAKHRLYALSGVFPALSGRVEPGVPGGA
jgi:hypothetical protein